MNIASQLLFQGNGRGVHGHGNGQQEKKRLDAAAHGKNGTGRDGGFKPEASKPELKYDGPVKEVEVKQGPLGGLNLFA
jgi:hypothetical protein